MTAVRKHDTQKIQDGRRGREQAFVPRPCVGDHADLVRAALDDTMAKHRKTLERLAKV